MQVEDNGNAMWQNRKREVSDWRTRLILGDRVGLTHFPAWLDASYTTLRENVVDPHYPCYFGTQAERRGEMFYSYVTGKDIGILPATMATFARLASQPEYRRNNIAVFFEPDPQSLSHQAYHDHFWGVLQHLHNTDPDPEADFQPDPNDEAWEFSFGGIQMFVVCACPSFTKRHSRNLGPGMILLFQPRAVFVDTITNKVIGREARNQVRERLRKWDAVEPHPDLGFYGDPGNLEWKQYFLQDDNTCAADRCPFLKRMQKMTKSASDHASTVPENGVQPNVDVTTPPAVAHSGGSPENAVREAEGFAAREGIDRSRQESHQYAPDSSVSPVALHSKKVASR